MLNIDTCRSYATRERLEKELAKLPQSWRRVVVRNTAGRWTAIFMASTVDGQLHAVASLGFMVIG